MPNGGEKRTAQMRSEITRAAEPARRTANRMQMDLAAELDKIIAYQVTRQQQYRNQYQQLLREQQQSAEMLRHYTPQLSSDASKQLGNLIDTSNQWHAVVRAGGFLAPMPTEVFTTRLFERHPLYERVLFSASGLETAIQDAIDNRLHRIPPPHRINPSLPLIPPLLPLTSP